MSKSATPQAKRQPDPALPRRLRWLQPLLALAGLASLSSALPARTVDSVAPIQRTTELRARLLAADAQAAGLSTPAQAAPAADEQLAQWQKWNDWNNWAKWAKQ